VSSLTLGPIINFYQDWLYDEGDDATKAVYVAKMDEIRFVAGPIVARYLDKLEEERQAVLKVQEEKAAKIKAEADAKKKADDEAKKSSEGAKKIDETTAPSTNGSSEDAEMVDAKPEVEEPAEEKK